MGNVAEIVLAPAAVRGRIDAVDRFLRANKEADAGRHLALRVPARIRASACDINAGSAARPSPTITEKARAPFDLGYESAQQR